jgi:hypothetical protein
MRSSWALFAAALAGTAVLAAGFALLITSVTASPRQRPALRGVPATTLADAGISLSTANQPPYCGAQQLAAARGWMRSGDAGCPIDRAEAVRSALEGEPGEATDAVLARVTATGATSGDIGAERLAWVVVVHSTLLVLPPVACAPPRAAGPACASKGPVAPPSNDAVVVVDGTSGTILATVPIVRTPTRPSARLP